ncbi:hypothetical protein SME20J_35550 [Serratia marcescens]|nr:hypothetical protein SME20J_35550 [Serratia marcescens]
MKKTSPSRRPAKARRERPDLYQQVTDSIIGAIERGTLPWRTDRNRIYTGSVMPQNGTTGYHDSGVNVLLLWIAAEERGFHSNRWLTYKQAEAVGGHVRAAETAILAVVFKLWDKQVEDADGRQLFDEEGKPLKTRIPMLKPLYLFNAAQCDNPPETIVGVMPAVEPEQDGASVDAKTQAQVNTLVEACGVRVEQIYQDRAFYSPLRDQIVLPQAQQFRTGLTGRGSRLPPACSETRYTRSRNWWRSWAVLLCAHSLVSLAMSSTTATLSIGSGYCVRINARCFGRPNRPVRRQSFC